MKHSKLVLIIIIALLAFLTAIVAYSYWKVVFVQSYDVTLRVGNRMGFDLGENKISFGTMLPGTDSSRQVSITNSLEKPVKIIIKQTGNTSQFVSTENNTLFLEPKESKKIDFMAKIPLGAEFGNYSGKVTVWGFRA